MVTVPSTGLPWWDPGCETPTVYVEGISGSGGEFGEACGSLFRGPVGKIIETYPLKMDGCYVSLGEGVNPGQRTVSNNISAPIFLASFCCHVLKNT